LRNGRIHFDKEVKDTSLEEITELVISEVRRALARQTGLQVEGAQSTSLSGATALAQEVE